MASWHEVKWFQAKKISPGLLIWNSLQNQSLPPSLILNKRRKMFPVATRLDSHVNFKISLEVWERSIFQNIQLKGGVKMAGWVCITWVPACLSLPFSVEQGLLQWTWGRWRVERNLPPSSRLLFVFPSSWRSVTYQWLCVFSSEILEIVLFFGSRRLLQLTRRPCTPRVEPSFHLHLKTIKSRATRTAKDLPI